GIGAGPDCDGQVLVVYDLLGMNPEFSPRFVKKFADLAHVIGDAAARYRDEVRGGSFPAAEHTFTAEKPGAAPAPVKLYSVTGRGGLVRLRAVRAGGDVSLRLSDVRRARAARAAAVRSAAARTLSRRVHGGGEAVRALAGGLRLLRGERFPAAPGRAPHGPGSEPGHRGGGAAHRPGK